MRDFIQKKTAILRIKSCLDGSSEFSIFCGFQQSRDLFTSLYKSWCVSPVAAIGLSFLSGCYRHAGDLVRIIGDDEINMEMLVELDRLVQLIESPLLAREYT